MSQPYTAKSTKQTHPFSPEAALALAEARYQARAAHKPPSLLSILDLDAKEMKNIIGLGLAMKETPKDYDQILEDKSVALLFQKTSTRTRCSFENAVTELGGAPSYIDWRTSNFTLSALEDETIVLSRYYDLIAARVNAHETLKTMAAHSEVPVINGLSDQEHPCQILGDFLTLAEYFGEDLTGLKIAYIGDGNNVCRSLAYGSLLMGTTFTMASPLAYALENEPAFSANGISYAQTPVEAVQDADVIYTDTWVSMGDEAQAKARLEAFAGYQVDEDLMASAPHALFMHCLPAHPGQEVTAGVLRSPRSLVFDQAENRKHAQKALLAHLVSA